MYGSSTIGVKKSTVCTSAGPPSHLYTPASSAVLKSTRTRSSVEGGMAPSTWASSPAASLLAQPAQAEYDVSFLIVLRLRNLFENPVQFFFARELDLNASSFSLPHDFDLRAQREAQRLFGRARIRIFLRRRLRRG